MLRRKELKRQIDKEKQKVRVKFSLMTGRWIWWLNQKFMDKLSIKLLPLLEVHSCFSIIKNLILRKLSYSSVTISESCFFSFNIGASLRSTNCWKIILTRISAQPIHWRGSRISPANKIANSDQKLVP